MNTPSTSFSITIPKPCHEDWNKMTPDEKGAFCGSCQKSVYDFSGKTDAEVSAILMANQGKKICGRFDAHQLDRPVDLDIPVYNIPRNISPARAFALALFLVFGSFLFNCSTASGQIVGKMKLVEAPIPKETGELEVKVQGQTKLDPPKVLGGPKYTPTQQDSGNTTKTRPKNTKTPKNPPVEPPKYFMMGDVSINQCSQVKGEVKVEKPETKDSVKTLLPPTAPVTGDTLVQKEIIMGKPSFHPVVIDGPQKIDPVIVPVKVETQEVRIDTMQVEQPVTVTQAGNTIRIAPLVPEKEPVSLEVMPNPSRGLLNLKYVIREKGATTIELYNLNGTRVKTFVSSQLIYEGTYKTTFDISDLPDGIYICTLRSGEQTASNKVILTK